MAMNYGTKFKDDENSGPSCYLLRALYVIRSFPSSGANKPSGADLVQPNALD